MQTAIHAAAAHRTISSGILSKKLRCIPLSRSLYPAADIKYTKHVQNTTVETTSKKINRFLFATNASILAYLI